MACRIAAATPPCASCELSSSLLRCRPPDSASFKFLSSKQSLLSSPLPEVISFGATPTPPASLRVWDVADSHENSGPERRASLQRSNKSGWDGIQALTAAEGLCLMMAPASYTASVIHNKRNSLVASSTSSETKLFGKVGDFSTWYIPALWAALVINAIVRALQWQPSSRSSSKVLEPKSIKDFTLDQRVVQLEEDVRGVAAIARMLSRHLEKLGLRVRVTRRTLRDPIQEAAVLAQKTSEVVSALASRDDMLEKELRQTQQILVAMQAQQEKQLKLIVAGMTKSSKPEQTSEKKLEKDLSRRVVGDTSSSMGIRTLEVTKNNRVASEGGKKNLVQKIGGMGNGLKRKEQGRAGNLDSSSKRADIVEIGAVPLKKQQPGDQKNGGAVLVYDTKVSQKKQTPNTSFTKEDFWATTTTRSVAVSDLSLEHDVVDYLTNPNKVKLVDAQPQYTDHPQNATSSGRLDSFFQSRKDVNAMQGFKNLTSQDINSPGFNPVHVQTGEQSSCTRHAADYSIGYSWDNSAQGKEKPPSFEGPEIGSGNVHFSGNIQLNNTIAGDYSSGAGSPRMGEGILNFVQAGFVDTDILREYTKDGYISN